MWSCRNCNARPEPNQRCVFAHVLHLQPEGADDDDDDDDADDDDDVEDDADADADGDGDGGAVDEIMMMRIMMMRIMMIMMMMMRMRTRRRAKKQVHTRVKVGVYKRVLVPRSAQDIRKRDHSNPQQLQNPNKACDYSPNLRRKP